MRPGRPNAVADEVSTTLAQQQIKGPAIGLLVTGILDLLMVPLLALCFLWFSLSHVPSTAHTVPSGPASVAILLPLGIVLLPGGVLIFAAIKMRRLQAYGLAIVASILAMIVSPCNLIGLPIGIWALVVLSQRDVRAAFTKTRRPTAAGPASVPSSGNNMTAGKMLVLVTALVLAVAILMSLVVTHFSEATYSGMTPPQLQSQATADINEHPGGPWITRLPSGISVELVGLGDYDGPWWQPDGSPLAEPPCQPITKVFGSKSDITRCFFARLGNLPSKPVGMQCAVEPSSTSSPQREVMRHGRRVVDSRDFLAFEAAIPAKNRTVTMRCGISDGPWEDIAGIKYDPDGSRASYGQLDGAGVGGPIETKDAIRIVAWNRLADEIRVIAICDDGREVLARLQMDLSMGGTALGSPREEKPQRIDTATFPGLTLKKIKEIKLQHRPYHWVEFRNVSLYPNPMTPAERPPAVGADAIAPAK